MLLELFPSVSYPIFFFQIYTDLSDFKMNTYDTRNDFIIICLIPMIGKCRGIVGNRILRGTRNDGTSGDIWPLTANLAYTHCLYADKTGRNKIRITK